MKIDIPSDQQLTKAYKELIEYDVTLLNVAVFAVAALGLVMLFMVLVVTLVSFNFSISWTGVRAYVLMVGAAISPYYYVKYFLKKDLNADETTD